MKTPVTSIKGFTQMLQRRLSPESLERAGKYLRVINEQTDRLTALINDLLDLSRIQTGRFHFDMVDLEYADLVREVSGEMQMIHPEHEIAAHAPEEATICGNANRLRQVLVNLIDNAVKYGPAGGAIAVTVQGSNGACLTRVEDEGMGLSFGESERVFNPYYQVDGDTHIAGLGLGLYISRQIVEEHGGQIWLEAGERTAFCFSLPMNTPEA
ncbi:MAG: hypothetical protein PVSMB7_28850 [Chloroflexota bacterium]